MIIALSSHLAAVIMINLLSIAFIAFGMKRISYGKRFEDDIDKHVLSFFILGVIMFMLGILIDTLSLMGMNSYLINHASSLIFKMLAPACFIVGGYFLRMEKR